MTETLLQRTESTLRWVQVFMNFLKSLTRFSNTPVATSFEIFTPLDNMSSQMIVTDVGDILCWWQNYITSTSRKSHQYRHQQKLLLSRWFFNIIFFVGDFFCHVGRFDNVKNLSSKSQNCHQQGPSPTSVNNIDVALFVSQKQTASLFEMKMGRWKWNDWLWQNAWKIYNREQCDYLRRKNILF